MSDSCADNCVLDGNPLHREQLEILDRIGGALALNTVIDDRRRLAFVNFGECRASHLEAVGFVRRYAEVTLPRRFSTVVTSAAGYPLDKTYYQTVKGMVGALGALEDGGDLIVASECSEGIGSPEYREAQRRLVEDGPDAFLAGISGKAHAEIDEWQTQMQTRSLAHGRVSLFTEGSLRGGPGADRRLVGDVGRGSEFREASSGIGTPGSRSSRRGRTSFPARPDRDLPVRATTTIESRSK